MPIRLADGQEWAFPKPFLQIHASFDGGKARATWPVLTYGPALDALIEAMGECDDNADLLVAGASLGAFLLRQNYSLEDRELDMLFAFQPGVPESWDWVNAVIDVATGQNAPKRGSGGGI